jgi:DNA-binding NtrC family response regulator
MTDPTERFSSQAVPVQTLRVRVVAGGPSAEVIGESISVGTATTNALVLDDRSVSRFHVELTITARGIEVVDLHSTNGTFVGAVRVERAVVPVGTTLVVGGCQLRVDGDRPGQGAFLPRSRLGGILGESLLMRRLMDQVQRVASTAASVHLVGESGTGKEVVARAIHDLGARAQRPFEVVDCGALLPALVASELFGHEKGAFTGADRAHQGAFERAHGGTLFIDEVGELPLSVQPSLLGVLERRKVRRLGGKTDIPVDVRIVSATHRDLRTEVNESRFRLDLYYRIGVVTLKLPPLRERPEDIPLLIEHFLHESGYAGPVADLVSPEAMAQLRAHTFPGNVRELRNVVEALLAMGELPRVEQILPESGAEDLIAKTLDFPYKQARDVVLRAFEARYLPSLLQRSGNNVAKASRNAEMDRSHLIDLLRRHGLKG